MTSLAEAFDLARADHGLAIVSTVRADYSIQATLVNAGIIAHPSTKQTVLGIVVAGRAKLAHLRARPQVSVAFRDGWRYATVEGLAQIAGPDDPQPWLDAEGLRVLLRDIFTAAGGTHEDFEEYDRVMVEQRRAAVLITPTRIYGG